LDEEDVVRHRLVKHILRAYTKEHEKDNKEQEKNNMAWALLFPF
jgi:phosphate starvation-inducible PhoH-like protein